MDTKRLSTMILLSFAVIFGWKMYVDYLYTQHPEWKRPGDTATTMPATAPSTTTSSPTSLTSTMPAAPGTAIATGPASAPTMAAAPLHVISAATQPS